MHFSAGQWPALKMRRFLLKSATLFTLLFAPAILLIRAQPYDDPGLHALLAQPAHCPMPCFMGIRPGSTMMDEARTLLEAHAWVGEIEQGQRDRVSIRWEWSGAQPALIDSTVPGILRMSSGNRVGAIYITTHVPFETMRLLLGLPAWLNTAPIETGGRTYYFGYPDQHLLVWVQAGRCGGIWNLLGGSSSFAVMAELVESPYAFASEYIHRANLYEMKRITSCRPR